MRFDQCLQGFAALFRDEVNITDIVGMSGENRPKVVVFGVLAAVVVGHFGPLPNLRRAVVRRSPGSHRALLGPSSGRGG